MSKDFDNLFCFITPHPAPNDMTVRRTLRLVYKLYLADRSQYVCIETSNSSKVPLTHGMPQGSVPSLFLFNTYTDNLS